MASPVNEGAKNAIKSNQCDTIIFVIYNWTGGFLSHCYLLKKDNRNVMYYWTGGLIIPCRGICPLYTIVKLFNHIENIECYLNF